MAEVQSTATERTCKYCQLPFVGHGNATGHQECMAKERKRKAAESDKRRPKDARSEKNRQWRERNAGYMATKACEHREKCNAKAICDECGREFIYYRDRRKERRLCSRECCAAWLTKTKAAGKAERRRRRLIESTARIEAKREARRTAAKLARLRICKICNAEFETMTHGSHVACSLACLLKVRKENKRTAKRRRKARKLGCHKEPYRDVEIFARDKWKCWICCTQTDRTKTVPHPDAPTIDHVVPLARGGADSPSNVACAHFSCNLRKSHKTITLF